jgi:hypothetical protein
MPRFATVTSTTATIVDSGRNTDIPPGRYEIVNYTDTDQGVAYVVRTNGTLACISIDDPNITIEES